MSDPAQLYEEDLVCLAEIQARALRDAARSGEMLPDDLAAASYTDEQVLGDWFPGGSAP